MHSLFAKFYKIGAVASIVAVSACQSVPNSPVANGNQHKIAQTRTALAEQYYQAGDLDNAKRQVDLALSAMPNHAQATAMLAMILAKEGSPANLSLAEQYFKQAIKSDGNDALVAFWYAMHLVQTGRLSDSAAWFEKAGSTLGFDGRVLALENLAYVRVQMWQNQPTTKHLQLAKSAIKRAIDAGSHNANLLNQARYFDHLTH